MCTCITSCWIIQLFNTTLISPVAFGERKLFVVLLLFAGPDTLLILL